MKCDGDDGLSFVQWPIIALALLAVYLYRLAVAYWGLPQ